MAGALHDVRVAARTLGRIRVSRKRIYVRWLGPLTGETGDCTTGPQAWCPREEMKVDQLPVPRLGGSGSNRALGKQPPRRAGTSAISPRSG